MKLLKCILLMTIFAGALKANPYSELINEGDSYYKKYDNMSALKKYEEAYKLAPNNYDVLVRLTRTYNDAGEELKELHKRDQAEGYITKALKFAELFKKKFPDSASVYAYLALSYGNMAMYVGGKDKITYAHKIKDNATKALKMNPNDYLPYIILGIYNREVAGLNWFERAFANTFFGDVPDGSYEESEKMFNSALKIYPGMIVATYQLSKTYRELENEKKEKELLNQVLKLPMKDFRDKFAKEKARIRLTEL